MINTETTENIPATKTEHSDFSGLGISQEILAVLEKLQFKVPTPIQYKAIPVATEGKDVVGIAQTGTGKTLAFGIPMIQRLMEMQNNKGLIILPTRELALQVEEALQKIGRGFGLKTAVLIGGASMGFQITSIRRGAHIIVGTPGRINDHLKQRTLSLSNVAILVLDEADLMLDMGFAPQIKLILQSVPTERQTMLFSATMPKEIMHIAATYMKLPVRVEIAPPGTKNENVEHELFFTKREMKMTLLQKVLQEYKGSVLVFTRTKHSAKKLCDNLVQAKFSAAEIHSNRSLVQRRAALDGFKQGKYRILVATDIASRGIDVKGIELVVNYDLPEHAGDYVHRIGRTGRAGLTGKAISFVIPEQRGKVREIERLMRVVIPVSQMAGMPYVEAPEKHYSPAKTNHYKPYKKSYNKKPFPKRY